MHTIIGWDKDLFRIINTGWTNPVFDNVLPWLRISYVWAPLYLFILVYALTNFKKNAGWWIILAAVTAAVTDFVSSSVIKDHTHRLRPFLDPDLINMVKVRVISRPANSSFTSSHAANHFGLAAYFYYTLKDMYGKWMLLFFLWAFIICLAQVYVGVHFPLDVVCGGIIGFVFGYLFAKSFNKRYSLM
jgi:membrane-associated phospholipid phosphatase